MKTLPYGRQSINDKDQHAVAEALKGEYITRGPKVEEFEEALASYCGAKFAVAFNSGTAALMGAYFAGDVSSYDKVLTTPNTFIASVGPAIQAGATPVFVDIDRSTGNLNLDLLEHNLDSSSSRGKLFISPVHFSGIAVDMQRLDGLINNPHTIVIEDAAHAIGSEYADGSKVGNCNWSHMTMFSFHPVKTMTTGEGGLVTTNDEKLYDKLKLFRHNGIERKPNFAPWMYEVHALTGNYNFTDFQAALGLSQFSRLEKFVAKRRKLVKRYREKLKNVKLFTSSQDEHTAFHILVAQIDFAAHKTTREQVMEKLKAKGIGTQVHYIPLYRHPVLKNKMGDLSEYFPEMEAYYAQALTLPLYYDMEEADVDYVCQELKKILG